MDDEDCPGCGTRKPLEEFNWKSRARGVRQVRCRSCTRAQVQDHYRRNRTVLIARALRRNADTLRAQHARVLEYLTTHPCVDCGESDPVCLEFDHVRGDKIGSIGTMVGDHCWQVVEAEIGKCDVRCANCHRRKTARERGWYRGSVTVPTHPHP